MKTFFGILVILATIFTVSFVVSYGWELGFLYAIAGKVVG